jgi:hypothetical protein
MPIFAQKKSPNTKTFCTYLKNLGVDQNFSYLGFLKCKEP